MPLPSSCKMDRHGDVPTNAVYKTDSESLCAISRKVSKVFPLISNSY